MEIARAATEEGGRMGGVGSNAPDFVDGKANVTSLVERVIRFAIFLRNNDRQSRPVMDGLI